MNIVTKILSPIVKPIIGKVIMDVMKQVIQPILDLVQALVQPQQGTKFLITIAGMAAIYFLQAKGIGTTATTVSIAAIVCVYYIADIYHKSKKQESGQ